MGLEEKIKGRERCQMNNLLTAEVEEMKRALEEQMKKNQEELEDFKKSYEERQKEMQTANAVSCLLLCFANNKCMQTAML